MRRNGNLRCSLQDFDSAAALEGLRSAISQVFDVVQGPREHVQQQGAQHVSRQDVAAYGLELTRVRRGLSRILQQKNRVRLRRRTLATKLNQGRPRPMLPS